MSRAVSELGIHMWAPLRARPQLTSGCTQQWSKPRLGAQPDLGPLQPGMVLWALRGARCPSCFHLAASSAPPCAGRETHVRPSQELAHQSPQEGESL